MKLLDHQRPCQHGHLAINFVVGGITQDRDQITRFDRVPWTTLSPDSDIRSIQKKDKRTFEVTDELRNANIPQEVQWNDIDYMDRRRDFTFDPKNFHFLPWKIAELHKKRQKYVAILDPAIPSGVGNDTYEPLIDGLAKNVFISENNVPVNGSGTVFDEFDTLL